MKIHDEALWEAQKAEIAGKPDAEVGYRFLDFCEAWCDAAEAAMDRGISCEDCDLVPINGVAEPIVALRETLEPTQQEKGHLPPGWLGQLLLVICSNWAHGGDELFDSMNQLEQRFLADAAYIVQTGTNPQVNASA